MGVNIEEKRDPGGEGGQREKDAPETMNSEGILREGQ